jgi:cytoskeletal protein RodZ
MIVKGFRRGKATTDVEAKGFDAFELRLGDLMRGERATMGKSLLDVQRELKIKAAYIAAIENADPTAFDTPGFIAGYVRSYARYLNMDPDWAFDTFCAESGFATAHGMSAAASSVKPLREPRTGRTAGSDMFSAPATPFIPARDALFSRVEPGAIGSVLVLVLLIGGLGYGGWTVLQEVQKVQFAPVEQTPTVVSDLDPLAGVATMAPETGAADIAAFDAPSPEALDRLYRPQALDVPVLVARDGPISTLDPAVIGTFGSVVAPNAVDPNAIDTAVADALSETAAGPTIQVTEGPVPELQLVAVRPAWVRVKTADGTVIFEGILNAGDNFVVPPTEEPATLRVGESGAIYFAVNGTPYGPAGPRGTVSSNLPLSVASVSATYSVADLSKDDDLARIVSVAEALLQP